MRLDEYRKEVGLSQHDFGATLEPPVGQSMVSQWECGSTRVTLEYAVEIQKKTGYKVTVHDCLEMFAKPEDRKKTEKIPN